MWRILSVIETKTFIYLRSLTDERCTIFKMPVSTGSLRIVKIYKSILRKKKLNIELYCKARNLKSYNILKCISYR